MSMLPCVDEISCLNLHPLKSGPPTLPLVQREFRTNEGNDDFATIPEVTLSGDFVIEFDCLIADASSANVIIGNSAGISNSIFVTSNDLSVRDSDGITVFTSGDVFSSNVINNVKVVVVGSIVEIFINGVSEKTGSVTGTFTFDQVYARQNGSIPMGGILANLKIYDVGTLIRNYPINDGKNILANVATALGNEIDGLTYALTTAIGGVASVVLSSLSVIGKTYLVEVSYSGVVGDASVRIGGFSGPSFTGTGTIEFVAT
ncbi:MAG: hypothetical protein ACPH3C_07915, partial [Glaciecola sp.]